MIDSPELKKTLKWSEVEREKKSYSRLEQRLGKVTKKLIFAAVNMAAITVMVLTIIA